MKNSKFATREKLIPSPRQDLKKETWLNNSNYQIGIDPTIEPSNYSIEIKYYEDNPKDWE